MSPVPFKSRNKGLRKIRRRDGLFMGFKPIESEQPEEYFVKQSRPTVRDLHDRLAARLKKLSTVHTPTLIPGCKPAEEDSSSAGSTSRSIGMVEHNRQHALIQSAASGWAIATCVWLCLLVVAGVLWLQYPAKLGWIQTYWYLIIIPGIFFTLLQIAKEPLLGGKDSDDK